MTLDFSDDPQEVLSRFEEHLRAFPGHGAGQRWRWAKLYFELRWRWGEGVRCRPGLCDAFLETAARHLSDKARGLFAEVERHLLAACDTLEGAAQERAKQADDEDLRWHVLPTIFGWPAEHGAQVRPQSADGEDGISVGAGPPRLSSADFLCQVRRIVSTNCRFACGRLGHEDPERRGRLVAPQHVEKCIEDCERLGPGKVELNLETNPGYLTLVNEHLGGPGGDAFAEALKGAEDATAELTELLLVGQGGELWRAAWGLLASYHAFKPRLDRTFGVSILCPGLLDEADWGLIAMALGVEERVGFETAGDETKERAETSLFGMKQVTQWLSKTQQPRGTEGDAEAQVAPLSPPQEPTPVPSGLVEDPKHVLERFASHVAEFPEDNSGWQEWREKYFDLQWRYVKAVRLRPDLRDRFLEMAGLHVGERARALVTDLGQYLLDACEVMRGPAEAVCASVEGAGPEEIRRQRPFSGVDGSPPRSWSLVELLDHCETTRGVCNWLLHGGVARQLPNGVQVIGQRTPETIREELRGFFRDATVPWLGELAGRLGGPVVRQMQQPLARAEQALGRLEELLVKGWEAELWEAAFALLQVYHAVKRDPESGFGAEIEDWPRWRGNVQLTVLSVFATYREWPQRDMANKTLGGMNELTRWLLPDVEPQRAPAEEVLSIVEPGEAVPRPNLSEVRFFYRWYERLRIERERVRRTQATDDTIQVTTWERVEGRMVDHPRIGQVVWKSMAEIERERKQFGVRARAEHFGRIIRRKDKVEDVEVWQWLRLWCVKFGSGDVRTKAIADLCERYPKGDGPQVAALPCHEYHEVLGKALDICCDEMVKMSHEHRVSLPWAEGEERTPRWQEKRDRISRILRERDPDQYAPNSVAAIQDHAELPPLPEAAEPEAERDDVREPATSAEASGTAGEPAFTIDEYYEKYGKTDADGTRLVGNVSVGTAQGTGRQSRYNLAGKEANGSGRRGDPYRYPLSVLLKAFPP